MGVIRLLLAISVVIAHSGPIFGCTLVGGQVAVQVFYIISGFYMSLILNEKYNNIDNSYKLFITNRFLRLFPIYWVVLILSIIIPYVIHASQSSSVLYTYTVNFSNMSVFSIIYSVFSNLVILGQDFAIFLGFNSSTGNPYFIENYQNHSTVMYQFMFIPQAWTIAVEIMFYLIAPFILKRKVWVIFTIILFSVLCRLLLYKNGYNHDPWTYRFFPNELVFFMLGNLSYRLYDKIRNLHIRLSYFSMAFIFIIVFIIFYTFINFKGKSILFFAFFTLLLPLIFKMTKNIKIDTQIGDLSYPVYISHIFVFFILKAIKVPILNNMGLILSTSTILFSILLNLSINSRIEKYRQSRLILNR
jgi:peptidoglycan/LPS O-acetylase OafA/YrhL